MNKRLISKLMRERVSGVHVSGGYFFRGDFEYVLQGVLFEYVPRGVYIWGFRFPLFDFFGENLLYSSRLSNKPFIGKGEMSEHEIVDHALSAPEVKSLFSSGRSMSLSEFLSFLESGDIANPHAHLIRAAALVLLGKDNSASQLLDELGPRLHPADVAHYLELKNALEKGHAFAESLLEQIRQENIKKLVAA
ncbi:hypothetical protein [Xanthomonas sp. 3307]|uniref:hypothetical protein n=1 Tax=Xanthomonas sp. 3307 TaxID=3035316 RepID=UPI0016172702|nr:hypothetical protein [Xanthomonas sp. 3307]MBB5940553.1 hypothetical protein [Xanthomonas sp. 3307]